MAILLLVHLLLLVGLELSAYSEIGYESYEDFGVDTLDGTDDAGEGDLCFTWRDYGRDDDPENYG